MLRTTLEFLSGELKAYIERKDPAMFQNEIAVLASSLMKPDGTFAIGNAQNGETFRIVMTLVNLEEDRIAESQKYFSKVNDKVEYSNPPVNLNAYVLFSAMGENYLSDLRLISYIVNFFQSNPVFEEDRFPHLNAKVEPDKPWFKVQKLMVTLHPMTFEQQNNLWAAIGAKYMPSVLFKIRTLTFIDTEPKMEAPPITEVRIFDN
jgi:hypothetical protein